MIAMFGDVEYLSSQQIWFVKMKNWTIYYHSPVVFTHKTVISRILFLWSQPSRRIKIRTSREVWTKFVTKKQEQHDQPHITQRRVIQRCAAPEDNVRILHPLHWSPSTSQQFYNIHHHPHYRKWIGEWSSLFWIRIMYFQQLMWFNNRIHSILVSSYVWKRYYKQGFTGFHSWINWSRQTWRTLRLKLSNSISVFWWRDFSRRLSLSLKQYFARMHLSRRIYFWSPIRQFTSGRLSDHCWPTGTQYTQDVLFQRQLNLYRPEN